MVEQFHQYQQNEHKSPLNLIHWTIYNYVSFPRF